MKVMERVEVYMVPWQLSAVAMTEASSLRRNDWKS